MDYNPAGSSVHGIFQARKLEWVAIPFSHSQCIYMQTFFGLWVYQRPASCHSSVCCPAEDRELCWQHLASDFRRWQRCLQAELFPRPCSAASESSLAPYPTPSHTHSLQVPVSLLPSGFLEPPPRFGGPRAWAWAWPAGQAPLQGSCRLPPALVRLPLSCSSSGRTAVSFH